MTQVYDDRGRRVAVTVIEAGPCVVTQRKTVGTDGYEAVQLGFSDQKESRVSKPVLGHLRKAGCGPKRVLREFAVEEGDELKAGDTVGVAVFDGVSRVDITGITKGRGFQGVVKRFNAAGGRMTHGGHSKRRIGSIGQCSYPARVMKGQKMPGHMGCSKITQQSLKIVALENEKNLILINGAVPGPVGGIVLVRKALKKAKPVS